MNLFNRFFLSVVLACLVLEQSIDVSVNITLLENYQIRALGSAQVGKILGVTSTYNLIARARQIETVEVEIYLSRLNLTKIGGKMGLKSEGINEWNFGLSSRFKLNVILLIRELA